MVLETKIIKPKTEAERLLHIFEHGIKYVCGHKLYDTLQGELAELRRLRGIHEKKT